MYRAIQNNLASLFRIKQRPNESFKTLKKFIKPDSRLKTAPPTNLYDINEWHPIQGALKVHRQKKVKFLWATRANWQIHHFLGLSISIHELASVKSSKGKNSWEKNLERRWSSLTRQTSKELGTEQHFSKHASNSDPHTGRKEGLLMHDRWNPQYYCDCYKDISHTTNIVPNLREA